MAGLRIAIIGAGPSGVVAVKALLAENKAFALIKVFERRDRAGGAWNYTPNDVQVQKKPVSIPSLDPRDVDPPIHLTDHHGSRESQTWPSPMYHRLNTNIPAELMAYHESPFPQQTELFPNRETVLMYLQDYASVVLQYISFGREVLSVIKPVNSDAWSVTSRAVSGKTEEVETFDRVIVASGHYETPKIPDIPGLKSLDDLQPEVVRHSKYYRTPAEYHGKKTVVVGSGPSGADIADQIAEVASLPVIRSTRSQTAAPILERPEVRDVGEIQCVKEDRSVKLKSGEIIEDVERILFCTGYLYSFPFLNLGTDERERLISDGERVRNLYEQIFYIPDPTIAFLAMGMNIVPFPMAEAQACYIARIWSGRLALPARTDMEEQEQKLILKKGDSRKLMALPHPEDGYYIESLRNRCLQSSGPSTIGMLSVDWRNSQRLQLRENGKQIKQDWLRKRRGQPVTNQ